MKRSAEKDAYDLSQDFLDPPNWEELRHYEELLSPFERATKHLEGNGASGSHGALWEVLDEYLQSARSIFMSPAQPPSLFTTTPKELDEDWLGIVCDHASKDNDEAAHVRNRQKETAELESFMVDRLDTTYSVVEIGVKVTKSYSNEPLHWWCERGEALYPTLTTMAYNLFSISGMSVKCERAFNAAKRIVTDERYNFKSDIIEVEQCIKNWLKYSFTNGAEAWQIIDKGIQEQA